MTASLTALSDWRNLSLPQQIAQMVVVRASGHLFDSQIQYPAWEPTADRLQHWIQKLGVGGVILLGGTATEVGLRTQLLQNWASVPLLIAADIEEGVGQRFAGATWFPPPMSIGAIAQKDLQLAVSYAEQMGAVTAEEALAIGINWILAPVVDVNNNPANPVINVRAWGETPEIVSHLATAYLRGAQRHPVLTAAKHFPGHGDTATDSHLDLPLMPHSLDRLRQIELPPFRAAMSAGVDAVMSAHLQVPSLDPDRPATLSAATLTTTLRQEMGFEGLIVTDALMMGAITQRYGANEAPVLAIEAGADLVLMPIDPAGAIEAIGAAVASGRIPLTQVHASLERIWQAKHKVRTTHVSGNSSHAWEQVPPPAIDPQAMMAHLAQPSSQATVTAMLKDSLRLHHPGISERLQAGQPAEEPTKTPLRNLIIVDDFSNTPFLSRQAPAILLPQERGYQLQWVDRHTPTLPLQDDPEFHQPTLLQLFVRGNPFRGDTGLTQIAQTWFQFLLQTHQLQALAIYGSPYLVEQFVADLPAQISYAFSYGQMPAAQAIVLASLLDEAVPLVQSTERNSEFTD